MSTLRAEFVELAAELIGDEFADFAYPCAMGNGGLFVYATQSYSGADTDSISMIRLDFKSTQFDGQRVMINDYMLIGEKQKLKSGFVITPDQTSATYRTETLQVIDVMSDPADAAIVIHVRRA